MNPKVTLSASVRRGPESWTYIYVALGFTIAIEGMVISLWTPLTFPWNVVSFVAIAFITGVLFLECGWFQNKLIRIKNAYESRFR